MSTHFVVLTKRILLFLILLGALASITPQKVLALCDNGKTGPKLGDRIDFFRNPIFEGFVRDKYNARNEPCQNAPVSVTILFTLAEVANPASDVRSILQKMHDQNFIPVIRLFTSYTGNGFTTVSPDAPEVAGAARQLTAILNDINFPQDVIVYLGNEVNSPDEWPDPASGLDLKNVTTRLLNFSRVFTAFSKVAGGNYKVYLPPLNAYLGSCGINGDYENWINILVTGVRNGGGRIDGAALTVYNDSPASIESDYERMRAAYPGVSSFTVSEVGPRVNCKLLDDITAITVDRPDGTSPWERAMTQVYQSQIGMFSSAEHVNSSFFLKCNGDLHSYLVVIGHDGVVGVEREGGITCENQVATTNECAPIGQVAETNPILNFFASLLSFFQPPPPPVAVVEAEYGRTARDINTLDTTYRPKGRPIGQPGMEYPYVSTLVGLAAKATESFFLPAIDYLAQHFFNRNDYSAGGQMPDYTVSTLTGNLDSVDYVSKTYRGYFSGPYDRSEIEAIVLYANDPNPNKQLPREFRERAGTMAKINPWQSFSGKKKRWVKTRDLWRERVIDAALRGYNCDINGKSCDDNWSQEYIAGYLYPADQSTLGAKSDQGNQVLADVVTTATWVSATPVGEVNRPLYTVEFPCTNANYILPDGVSGDDKQKICAYVMGPDYAKGIISKDSRIGQVNKYNLPTCSELCLYSYAWDQIPVVLNNEIPAEICENIDQADQDQDPLGNHRCKPTGIPGIQGGLGATKEVAKNFMTRDMQLKMKPYALPGVQCNQASVGGVVYDPLSNGLLPNSDPQYFAQKQINQDLPPAQGSQALGASSGQVLAESNPPSSSPPPQGHYTFNRNGSVTFKLTDDIPNLISWTESLSRLVVSREVGNTFDVTIGGVPLKARSTAMDFTCGNGDFNCTSHDVGIPGPGGPLDMIARPCHSVVSEAVLPFKNPCKSKQSVSMIFHDLAQWKKNQDVLAKGVWQELLSFSQPENRDISKR